MQIRSSWALLAVVACGGSAPPPETGPRAEAKPSFDLSKGSRVLWCDDVEGEACLAAAAALEVQATDGIDGSWFDFMTWTDLSDDCLDSAVGAYLDALNAALGVPGDAWTDRTGVPTSDELADPTTGGGCVQIVLPASPGVAIQFYEAGEDAPADDDPDPEAAAAAAGGAPSALVRVWEAAR